MKKYRWIFTDFILVSLIIAYAVTIVVFAQWNWKWICIYFITSYILNTIFIVFSIANNDNQTEKLSWIFFSCVIPYVGIVYYILFRVRRKKGKEIHEFEKEFQPFLINQYQEQNKINDEETKVKTWISKLVKRNFYKSNIKIFKYGIEAFENLINEMKDAKKYIFIEMYILKRSEIYEKLKEILIQKVIEGVDVRIILDKFGTWKVPIDELKYLKYQGIKLAFFNTPYYPYVRHTDNKRLHRKFYIIDGKSVYFGGLNISDEYCSFNKKYGFWADLNYFANGKIINDYQSVFIYDWYQLTKEKIDIKLLNIAKDETTSQNLILTFEDGPTKVTNYLEDTIDYLINSSQESIKIATPYLIPSEKVFNSLKNALQRNIDLEIYIPGLPDKKFTYQATLFYASLLTEYGAKIYKLNNIFLHSKYAIFDNNFSYIGTNNLDMRSFYTNQESINIVFGKSIINELNNTFDEYKLISIKHNKKISKIGRAIKSFIFKLCSPLM